MSRAFAVGDGRGGRALLAIGEAKWHETMGLAHLERPAPCPWPADRGRADPARQRPDCSASAARGFTAELRDEAAQSGEVRLPDPPPTFTPASCYRPAHPPTGRSPDHDRVCNVPPVSSHICHRTEKVPEAAPADASANYLSCDRYLGPLAIQGQAHDVPPRKPLNSQLRRADLARFGYNQELHRRVGRLRVLRGGGSPTSPSSPPSSSCSSSASAFGGGGVLLDLADRVRRPDARWR